MVLLSILSGDKAGTKVEVGRFPFTIGRSQGDHLRLEDRGVWESHLTISLREDEAAFFLQHHPSASVQVNKEAVRNETRLRMGDVIELGGARILFSLAPEEQRDYRHVEWSAWILLATVALVQIGLLVWLL